MVKFDESKLWGHLVWYAWKPLPEIPGLFFYSYSHVSSLITYMLDNPTAVSAIRT